MDPKLQDLYKKRDSHMTGFFWLGLHIAVIFALPAVIAVFAGNIVNKNFGITYGRTILLFVAFISSWVIVARIYIKKSKVLKSVEDEILQYKKNNNIN